MPNEPESGALALDLTQSSCQASQCLRVAGIELLAIQLHLLKVLESNCTMQFAENSRKRYKQPEPAVTCNFLQYL
jgi:hypothetical protein